MANDKTQAALLADVMCAYSDKITDSHYSVHKTQHNIAAKSAMAVTHANKPNKFTPH